MSEHLLLSYKSPRHDPVGAKQARMSCAHCRSSVARYDVLPLANDRCGSNGGVVCVVLIPLGDAPAPPHEKADAV